ncbi:MAG: hypothetical protein WCP34_07055 [Pseudomonadota bacterium]
MKSISCFKVAMVFCCLQFSGVATADETVKGKIKSYDLGKKTLVIAPDNGKSLTFLIQNEKALKSLDDQLFVDDEVKIRYSVQNGQNIISNPGDLRSTRPGC